jgi:hypothetical protein
VREIPREEDGEAESSETSVGVEGPDDAVTVGVKKPRCMQSVSNQLRGGADRGDRSEQRAKERREGRSLGASFSLADRASLRSEQGGKSTEEMKLRGMTYAQ